MKNNWFKNSGDLEENKSKDDGMSYFQRGGSLEEPIQTNEFGYSTQMVRTAKAFLER